MFRGGGLGLQELWNTVHHIVDHLCACGGTSITVHNMHTFACTPWQHAFICLASLYVQYQAPNRFSELKYIHACTNVNLKNSWSATLSLSSGCTPLEVFTCGRLLLHLWNVRDFWRPSRSTTSLSEKSRAIERRASRGAIPQKGGAAAEVQGGWAPSLQLAWQRWWC